VPYNLFGINTKDPFGLGGKSTNDVGKRRPIDKNTRDAVWLKYMGNKVEGKCYCCKIRPIHITDFQVGHVIAVVNGGKDNISNLRPICGPCNRGMKTMNLEQYKKNIFSKKSATKSTAKPSKKVKPKRKSKSNDPFGFGEFKPPKIKSFRF
jgi:5-methylcytosine-specific restriction endonuclease McrA